MTKYKWICMSKNLDRPYGQSLPRRWQLVLCKSGWVKYVLFFPLKFMVKRLFRLVLPYMGFLCDVHWFWVGEFTCDGLELLGPPLLEFGVCQAVAFPFTPRSHLSWALHGNWTTAYRMHVNKVVQFSPLCMGMVQWLPGHRGCAHFSTCLRLLGQTQAF